MENTNNQQVADVFRSYPRHVRKKLEHLRDLILKTAAESSDVDSIEETLKWGEPSYLTKNGSTIRIDWKESSPNTYAMYFNCKSKLVSTFRELYGDKFHFMGNRAIIFDINDRIPDDQLAHCILLALTYHQRKHLPMLGA